MMQGLLSARDVSTTTPSYTHEELVAGYFARARRTLLSGIGSFGLPLIFAGGLIKDGDGSSVSDLGYQLNTLIFYAKLLAGIVVALLPTVLEDDMFAKPVKGLEKLPHWQHVCSIGLTAISIVLLVCALVASIATKELSSQYVADTAILAVGLIIVGTFLTALFRYDQAIAFALNKPPNLP
jgi:hypothetical protein